MRKLLSTIGILALVGAFLLAAVPVKAEDPFCGRKHDWNAKQTFKKEAIFKDLVTVEGTLSANQHSEVFYVDSGSGANVPDWGKSWKKPLDTVEYALQQCTADRGDIIYLLPGHAVSISTTAIWDLDIAGVSIIGLGAGDNRPIITHTATGAYVDVAADDITLMNIVFQAGVNTGTAPMVFVEADDCTIEWCEFRNVSASLHTNHFIEVSGTDNAADRLTVKNCRFFGVSGDGDCDSAISLLGAQDSVLLEGNIISGTFDDASIHNPTGEICTNLLIQDNVIENTQSGDHAIELVSACTGFAVGNRIYVDNVGTAIDPGSLKCLDNLANDGTDEAGIEVPHGRTTRSFLEAIMAREIGAVAGSAEEIKVWWVDAGISASGDGKSPKGAFKTIDEAITVCSNSIDDWVLVQDYSGDTDTITINKAFVHLIGYGNPGMSYPRIQATTAGAAGLTLGDAADRVEIARFIIASNTTGDAVLFNGSAGSYDCWIHDCQIGRSGNVTQDGIVVGGGVGGAAPFLVIEDCQFGGISGAGVVRNGIVVDNNASGIIIRRNIFRSCGTQAINMSGSVESPMILDNTIQLPSDTAGYAVTLSTNCSRGCVMGNRASYGNGLIKTEVFLDEATSSSNEWAGNTGGGLDTLKNQAQKVMAAYGYGLLPGAATLPVAVWYVDANITTSGDGKSPFRAFKTIQEAYTVCSSTVDDWVFVFDYSGGGDTITIDKSFIHLIGNRPGGAHPYPRIMPATAVAGITFGASGDRVEIANFVIGGGDQTVPAISFPVATAAGAYGVHIHHNIIGRDATAPANDGILVASGGAAPYLLVEDNIFHGSAGAGCDQSGIEIAGNATRGHIRNNLFHDLGTGTHPAIYMSGGVTEISIEGNRIAGDDDTSTGWAITMGSSTADGWINLNYAGSSDDTEDAEAYDDDAASEANNWGLNYGGITAIHADD